MTSSTTSATATCGPTRSAPPSTTPTADSSVDLAGTGSVVDSLRLAGAALVAAEQRGLEAVLVDVVNRGGDADTNAAIAGGLLGARHGHRAVPDRWIARLEQRRRIERGAAQLAELASTGGGAS